MKEERVPDILIEQYILGELSVEEAARIEKTDGFVKRVAAIERDNAAFQEKFPAEIFSVRIRNQYEAETKQALEPVRSPGRTHRTVFRFMTVAVPGAALLVIGLILFGGVGAGVDPVFDPENEITRLKGDAAQISLYRSVGDESGSAEELSDGDRATEGDRLQVAYNAGGRSYGMIVSVDGRGALTLHFPVTASAVPELIAGGEQSLPYGYQLDDAPEFERFFFITSEDAFNVAEILSYVQDQVDDIVSRPDADLSLPRDFAVDSVTIQKGD